MREHHYRINLSWTGNIGSGTSAYREYERSFKIQMQNKPVIQGSSDPAFLGDPNFYNPEELLLMSVSSCHMLWYLHLCAESGVIVEEYRDNPEAIMTEEGYRGGEFSLITLRPKTSVRNGSDVALAYKLHQEAHQKCFIANSIRTEIMIESDVQVSE